MFDDLSRNLDKAWDMVRKDGKLSKDNIKEPMREIRRALLEADVSTLMLCVSSSIRYNVVDNVNHWMQVSLPVVRKFVKQVEENALGVKVVKGIKPDQQLVKVVNDQLIELMGGEQQDLVKPAKGPQVSSLQAMCKHHAHNSASLVVLTSWHTCSVQCIWQTRHFRG